MKRRFCLIAASLGLIATLGACHKDQKSGHGTVSGEILPGSVSDAMLPYDTVKSKPPLAPEQAQGRFGDTTADATDSADSAVTAAAAAPDTVASPAPPATAPAVGATN